MANETELLNGISDKRLKARLATAIGELKKTKQFGLVFEQHTDRQEQVDAFRRLLAPSVLTFLFQELHKLAMGQRTCVTFLLAGAAFVVLTPRQALAAYGTCCDGSRGTYEECVRRCVGRQESNDNSSSGYDYEAERRREAARQQRLREQREKARERERLRKLEEERKQREFEEGKQEALGSLKGVDLAEPGLKGVGDSGSELKGLDADREPELKSTDAQETPVPEQPKVARKKPPQCGSPAVVSAPPGSTPDPCKKSGYPLSCLAGEITVCCTIGTQAAFAWGGKPADRAGCCFESMGQCLKIGKPTGHNCFQCRSNQ